MSKKNVYRFKWIISVSILVLIVSGCGSKSVDSTATTAPAVEPTTAPPADVTADATPDPMTVTAVDENILYHDDFTNPASGWTEDKFDNFFVGYHEPEFYHVEVESPNYKTTVFEPGKDSFGDVSIEVKAFTASAKTAETGDFAFGPAFRRSGDQYYAFTISQRTKKWYVLKSTPNALVVLAEGTDDSIHDPDNGDVLRVDARRASFTFYVNDHLVGQMTDSDYATGEVGFFVQTFDVATAHVHFDELNISPLELLVSCTVKAQTLYVRSGPGTSFESSTFLATGATIEPIGRNENGDWLLISSSGTEEQSWVYNTTGFLSCDESVDILPVTSP